MKDVFYIQENDQTLERFSSVRLLEAWLEENNAKVVLDPLNLTLALHSYLPCVYIGKVIKVDETGEVNRFLYGLNTQESDSHKRSKLKIFASSITGLICS